MFVNVLGNTLHKYCYMIECINSRRICYDKIRETIWQKSFLKLTKWCLTAIFRARLSARLIAAARFSIILLSMIAYSSLVNGRKVGRLLSESFSAWISDILMRTMKKVTYSGHRSGTHRYHLESKDNLLNYFAITLHVHIITSHELI